MVKALRFGKACGLGVGTLGAHADDLPLQRVHVVLGDNASASGVDDLGASSRSEGDHGGTAGESLHIDGGVVLFPCGVDEEVGGSI